MHIMFLLRTDLIYSREYSHGGGGEVGVLVFQLAVQRQPPHVAVIGE